VIKTDHYSLKYLLDQRLSTISQHQWASKLLGFDFQVDYKPGANNVVADALSRHDTETTVVMAISSPSFQLFDNLRREIDDDLEFRALRVDAAAGTRGKDWCVASPTVLLALAAAHGAGH
jgi:hypothetical protein